MPSAWETYAFCKCSKATSMTLCSNLRHCLAAITNAGLTAATVHAATLTVTSTADATSADRQCKLREAITTNNAAASIPTLSKWGLIILSLMLAAFGHSFISRKARRCAAH